MRQSITSVSLARLALIVLAPAAAAGCGSEGPATAGAGSGADPVGRISLPLTASVGDHDYRLANIYMFVTGPQFLQLSDNAPDQPTLTATLQTGNYSAYLYSWTLLRDDGTGNFVPVVAELVTNTPVPFSIYNGSTTTIAFQFSTDGLIVTVGQGQLRVAISVGETPPVCAPLGSDCGDGAWCPPTGLTGTQVGCYAAGTAALGAACAGPGDCVANAACVDSGDGPVCTQLCLSSDFDTPCASGGICQRAGADYGLCASAAPAP